MKNKDAYASIRALYEETVAFYQGRARIGNLPLKHEKVVELVGPAQSRRSTVPVIDWQRAMLTDEAELKRLNSFASALEQIKRDPVMTKHFGTMVGTGMCLRNMKAEEYILDALVEVFRRHDARHSDTVVFEDAVFEAFYDEFEDFFYSDEFPYEFFAPVQGLKISVDRINLPSGVSISKISKLEKEELLAKERGSSDPTEGILLKDCAFRCELRCRKVIAKDGDMMPLEIPLKEASTRFDEVLTALRLFRAGFVQYDEITARPLSWDPCSGKVTFWSGRGHQLGPDYTLSESEVSEFEDFLRQFYATLQKRGDRFRLGVRRFNYGCERKSGEDKLIDYMIGLESLLLGNDRNELAYRLALRGAFLLGRSFEKREENFQLFRCAYGARSDLVHGGHPKPTVKVGDRKVPFDEFVSHVEDLLRRILKRYLDLYERLPEDDILGELDSCILRGDQLV